MKDKANHSIEKMFRFRPLSLLNLFTLGEELLTGIKLNIFFGSFKELDYRGFGFIKEFNYLQVDRGGGRVFDRDFTKSLIIRDFDDVLKNPFRYVDLFLLHTLLSKKIPKIAMQDL